MVEVAEGLFELVEEGFASFGDGEDEGADGYEDADVDSEKLVCEVSYYAVSWDEGVEEIW